MADNPRVLVVSEFWDGRGFGLSGAALAYTRSARDAGIELVGAVGIHAFSGQEPTDLPLVAGGAHGWKRAMKHAPLLPRIARERQAQVIHFHGCWTWAVSTIPALQRQGARVVLSPHGMFEPYILGRNQWKKTVMNAWFHRGAIAACRAIHALNQHEADCTRAYAGAALKAELVVQANGVEVPCDTPPPTTGKLVLLYCGRFDPKKRIDLLLEAWRAAQVTDIAELHLAGGGEDPHAQEMAARATATSGVRLLGRVSGAAKRDAFAASHLGILASASEGQPLALLESLGAGRPVICTPGCRLPEVDRFQLGWTSDGIEGLAQAIRSAVGESVEARRDRGERARADVREHHHWPTIGIRMAELYRRLAG